MRKPKYRVDTYYADDTQLTVEDRIDELAEQGWQLVTMFVHGSALWVISRRTWWWRLWN